MRLARYSEPCDPRFAQVRDDIDAQAPLVRVVVVNFNGGVVTLRCLEALASTTSAAARVQVVLVDNGSNDGILPMVNQRFPDIVVIESATNEGFARGCNLALENLEGVDFVALINNDAIVEAGWLDPLLSGFVDGSVGAVCPKVLLNLNARAVMVHPQHVGPLAAGSLVGVRVEGVARSGVDQTATVRYDERFIHDADFGHSTVETASMWWAVEQDSPAEQVTVTLSSATIISTEIGPPYQEVAVSVGPAPVTVSFTNEPIMRIINSAGGILYSGWFGGDRGFLEPDLGQFDEPAEVFSWSGGAVLLKTAYLQSVGLFDNSFFLYYEDFDLSLRGRAAGWTYRYEPASVVLHEHAYSSKVGSAFFEFWVDRNRRLALVKNAPASVAMRACVGSVVRLGRNLRLHTATQARARRGPAPTVVIQHVRETLSLFAALPGAVRERRRINKSRVVKRCEIERWTVTRGSAS